MMLNKIRTLSVILTLLIGLCCLFSSCSTTNNGEESESYCKVLLSESDLFSCSQRIKTVKRGDDVSFDLTLKNGYTFQDVNYQDYSVDISLPNHKGERQVNLSLKNVKYSYNIEISLKKVRKIYT